MLFLLLALLTRASADDAYRIGAGDTVLVTVYGEPSLTAQYPVDASGQVDFPLLGRVPVSALSPEQVAALLRDKLRDGYINEPNVTVAVSTYRSQPVQVLGAVAKPGVYFLRGPTSVMQMLSEAGGVSPTGVNEVRVSQGEGGASQVFAYETLLSGTSEWVLSGGDIVFVPESIVSVMGQVQKPGDVAFRDGLTVSKVIAAAGGASSSASLGRVYVLRGSERITVNVKKILSGRAPDLALEPGDQVFVAESPV